MLVIGRIKESRQALRRKVGIVSREQVALEEDKIALRTSSGLVGENEHNDGGLEVGRMCGEELHRSMRKRLGKRII